MAPAPPLPKTLRLCSRAGYSLVWSKGYPLRIDRSNPATLGAFPLYLRQIWKVGTKVNVDLFASLALGYDIMEADWVVRGLREITVLFCMQFLSIRRQEVSAPAAFVSARRGVIFLACFFFFKKKKKGCVKQAFVTNICLHAFRFSARGALQRRKRLAALGARCGSRGALRHLGRRLALEAPCGARGKLRHLGRLAALTALSALGALWLGATCSARGNLQR